MSHDQSLQSEIRDLKSTIEDLKGQVKNAQAERDLLAVMLNEAENAHRRSMQTGTGKVRPLAAGEFEHDPAKVPSNRNVTLAQVWELIAKLKPEDRKELERRLSL